MNEVKYNTIIVGAGIAGLTAAAYLARSEKKILLIEKNDETGGLVSSFQRDGFHFEAGVRALENAGVILPMLKDLGIELELVRSKVSIGIEDKILHIEDINSVNDYKKLLSGLYPESESEIDTFIKIMLKIMKHLDVLYGIENPAFKNLKTDKKYIFKKLLPWLPKFLLTVRKINLLNEPIEQYLKKIISNPSLRDIISQHFFIGTPTFFALSYFSLYLDYFYPVEGVGKLADKVRDKILEFRGELKTNTIIKEVHAHNKYVVDQDNNQYHYDKLIWAADLKTLYNIVDTNNLAEKIKIKFEAKRKDILKNRGSESVFTLYLEVDRPIEYFKKISNGHFFYTPSKKGLNNIHRSELDKLLSVWNSIDKNNVIKWLDSYLSLNTFEISIPGLKNKSLVPENKTGLIISFICDYELFAKVAKSGWYQEFRKEIENRLISILSKSVYPDLEQKIIKQFSFTPLSIKDRVASSEGAIVGWAFNKSIPVFNEIQKAGKSVFTPIPGIYQAGQWAYSPAGVPMSILTGKIAADKVIKT